MIYRSAGTPVLLLSTLVYSEVALECLQSGKSRNFEMSNLTKKILSVLVQIVSTYFHLLCSYDNDIVNFCSLTSNDNPWPNFSRIFNWRCIDKIIVVRWQYGSALVIKKLACFSLALVKVQRCLIIGANRSSKTQTWPTFYSSCLIFYQIQKQIYILYRYISKVKGDLKEFRLQFLIYFKMTNSPKPPLCIAKWINFFWFYGICNECCGVSKCCGDKPKMMLMLAYLACQQWSEGQRPKNVKNV